MKATAYTVHGDVTITYNPCNGDKLVSPDGTEHLLPCDVCRNLQWQELKVVSFTCLPCAGWKWYMWDLESRLKGR